MKLHIGCGSVLLEGYTNIDIPRDNMKLVAENRSLSELLRTTEDKYYAKHEMLSSVDALRRPKNNEGVCDVYGSAQRIPFPNESADEILLRQVFEHLSIAEAKEALKEFYRVLEPAGMLRIDVPDHDGTVAELMKSHDEFFFRHLYGSRVSEYGYHLVSYTREGLKKLVEAVGFEFIGEEPNIHFYPAICLRFVKRQTGIPAWQYASSFFNAIPVGGRCLEVGPGPYPWPRADVYVDKERKFLDRVRAGAERHIADVCSMPFSDKEFSFVYAAHILEHVEDPVAAAKELSRVAKRGLVIVPHVIKEILFAFEETTHRWWCTKVGDVLTFQEPDERAQALADVDAQRALCRLYRSAPDHLDRDWKLLKDWFIKNEIYFDVVMPWDGELRVQVLK